MTLPSTALSALQSLIQQVMAALGPHQNQRLLRLHTPFGPNVLLAERITGLEAIGPRSPGATAPAGFHFDVLALSTQPHLQLDELMGQPVRLDLLTQTSATELRPFHGMVTAFRRLGSDGGLTRYQLTIEPWLAFLAHRQDSWVFQDMTVPEIIDEVFTDYQAEGSLVPAWRWELADASVYARRSLCVQYQESDLAFVQRLLAEEGLFFWFEHEAGDGPGLGQHTLVIADDNRSFQPNVQAELRFTQSASASFKEDSLTRFDEQRRVTSTALSVASWNYRSVQQASAQIQSIDSPPAGFDLMCRDQAGAYAYESTAQAERIAQRQLEALQAPAHRFEGSGTWRQAACATTFSLREHPTVDAATRWVTTAVFYRARNNLSTDLRAQLHDLLGEPPAAFLTAAPPRPSQVANAGDEPIFQVQLQAQDLRIPVRAVGPVNDHGDLLFQRPRLSGVQTAIVVGQGEPVHTDRDGRIKVQFHWQRGASGSHRLDHPAGSNAPGNAGAGTWVRVSQAWAGDNWGGHQVPRIGQEVAIGFIEGDVDRPVALGSVYSGKGQPDAQGNQVAGGAAGATGNAPAWFPGNARIGELEGHQHPHTLSGYKSQSLESSSLGSGGYNQLVLDDSPKQSRVSLGSTRAASWLQMGHLLQQNDNQRLARRGHGLDLSTLGHGALRAASGLHLSTQARAQGSAGSTQLSDARAPLAQLEQAMGLSQALSDSAQKHNAKLTGEAAPDQLPEQRGRQALIDSQRQTDQRGGAAPEGLEPGSFVPTHGGAGSVAAPRRPDIVVHGDGGVFAATPGDSVWSAGNTLGFTAYQDFNASSARHTSVAVKSGISLFTVGQATNAHKPTQETGMALHAASGSVSVQAQSSTLGLTADQSITLASTTASLTVGTPNHLLLTAGGSAIRLSNGSITLTTPGPVAFQAAMRELVGGAKAGTSLSLPKTQPLKGCVQQAKEAAQTQSATVDL